MIAASFPAPALIWTIEALFGLIVEAVLVIRQRQDKNRQIKAKNVAPLERRNRLILARTILANSTIRAVLQAAMLLVGLVVMFGPPDLGHAVGNAIQAVLVAVPGLLALNAIIALAARKAIISAVAHEKGDSFKDAD